MLLGSQRINEHGHLEIGGCDTLDLVHQFGTPLYVMDESAIRDACRRYRAAFESRYQRNVIHYAGKAFLCLAMCRIIEQEGLGLDVAALGELHTAIEAGFPMSRVNLHGNNKSREELELAVRHRVGHITIDNEREIETLEDVLSSDARHPAQDVLIRCAPGVDPLTHRFMRTGQADTKFGFNIADGSAIRAVDRVLRSSRLRYKGLHFHVGSQLTDAESHVGAIETAVDLMSAIRRKHGAESEILNIGGGLGVRYLADQPTLSLEHFAEAIVSTLTNRLRDAGLPDPILAQEPGRAIVGEAGTTLYTVGAIKTVPILDETGTRTYASVDGGLSDNPRPQLYDAVYEARCANRADETHDKQIAIAGKHCETDVLIWNATCPELRPDDILAVLTTGAYNFSMASNYNRVPRPAVVLVNNGYAEVIVRRETPEDVVRRDVVPMRLSRKVQQA